MSLLESHSSRYSVGLAPHIRRNIRAKCCWLLKPQDGNIQDPRLGGAQQFFATLYPMSQDKLMRCLARGHAKHLREIRGAKARCLCHFSETYLVLDSCLH